MKIIMVIAGLLVGSGLGWFTAQLQVTGVKSVVLVEPEESKVLSEQPAASRKLLMMSNGQSLICSFACQLRYQLPGNEDKIGKAMNGLADSKGSPVNKASALKKLGGKAEKTIDAALPEKVDNVEPLLRV